MRLTMLKKVWMFVVIFSAGFVAGCDMEPGTPVSKDETLLTDKQLADKQKNIGLDGNEYLFGFDLRSSPQEDARQYLPFLKYLEQETGYKFKLRFTPKDGKIIDDLGTGKIHLAAIGATSYIRANKKYGVLPLVRGVNIKGKAEYRSMLVVRPDSPVKSLDDLYGKKFAFGNITSTQGHLIPRIILAQHDINLSDLDSYEYTGSHRNCADAVISRRFDICAMQDTMALELVAKKQLRIIFKSNYFPSSGIAVNKDLPEKFINKLRTALLNFKPKGAHENELYNWGKTEMPNGFIKSKDGDYNLLRHWMHKLKLSINNFMEARWHRKS